MKLAFIGTHGTGKTVLGYQTMVYLKKRGVDAEFLSETARKCPFLINEDTTKKAQEWIIFTQYTRELELQERCDVLVCDRSVFDVYVYYYNKFGKNKLLEDFVRDKIKEYDLLFKVPINQDYLTKDKIRSVNPKFQKDVDDVFNHLLQELKIPFQTYESLNKTFNIITLKWQTNNSKDT